MLNLKVNLLIKKIFMFFSLFIFCGMSTFGMESNTDKHQYEKINERNDFEHYAKVVVIGEVGSGKTTTWRIMQNPCCNDIYNACRFEYVKHTVQISRRKT